MTLCPYRNAGLLPLSSGARRILAESGWAILKPPAIEACDGVEFARMFGAVVARILDDTQPDAVVVFGGDTAYGILSALGCPPLRSLGEAVPGVPIASIAARELASALPGRCRDLLLAAKAGGFGANDAVARIRAGLTGV